MKIVNLLTILLVAIFLYALNDAASAEPASKKTTSKRHHNHPSTTIIAHHPSPTKHHNYNHNHHRNRNKTTTRKVRTTRTNRRTRTTRTNRRTRTTRTTRTRRPRPTPTPSLERPRSPAGEPIDSYLDPISSTPDFTSYSTPDLTSEPTSDPSSAFASDALASPSVPTNAPSPNVSDPNEPSPASTWDGQGSDPISTKSVVPGTSNGNFSLAIGIIVGGVAALGLAGYAVHRHREVSRNKDNNDIPPQVSTRWRHQSFLAKVESIVARLPSDSRSSRSSAKSKKSSLSGPMSPSSPVVDNSTIPVASTSQANYGGGGGPEYMEEVHLR